MPCPASRRLAGVAARSGADGPGCRVTRATGVQSERELAFAGLHQLCAPMLDQLDTLPLPQRDALRTVLGVCGIEEKQGMQMTTVHYRYATVQGRRLFYREAGPPSAPIVLLLHGFPASSFMFRDLIPRLANGVSRDRPRSPGLRFFRRTARR